jgi:GrpB-like predicted nucleotidyltransferase (UPF0157 family)
MGRTLEQRIADAIRDEIAIVTYDPSWPTKFALEVEFLEATLPRGIVRRYEHFGSTAVPGLAAKPIVDLLVEVGDLRDVREQIVPVLVRSGYDYFWRTDVDTPYAYFIKRDGGGTRTHHLHMVEATSPMWDRLLFRDYLRVDQDEAERYAALKRHLATEHPKDRIAYTHGKTVYIAAVMDRARSYFGAT